MAPLFKSWLIMIRNTIEGYPKKYKMRGTQKIPDGSSIGNHECSVLTKQNKDQIGILLHNTWIKKITS